MPPTRYSLGLIGYPLEHSRSPEIHQAALKVSGLVGEYRLYPVAPLPAGQEDLVGMLQRLRQGSLQGLNVTIPHKQNVLPYLDALTPAAEAVSAANTLSMENGLLTGDNTDIQGFLADLHHYLPGPAGNALVLGAGGSARAVVFALQQAGWVVAVAARRLEQAASLLNSLNLPSPLGGRAGDEGGSNSLSLVPQGRTGDEGHNPSTSPVLLDAPSLVGLQDIHLIVNTTPLGMIPNPDASPWPQDLPLPAAAFVYDLVYNPPETRLVRQARQAGLLTANGLGMLVEQAILSFERWTGVKLDRDAFRQQFCRNTAI